MVASLCWLDHRCRDYGLVPQALKDGVSAEPHQQLGDGAGQNYP